MSLTWDWNDKMGEVIYNFQMVQHDGTPWNCNIYQGNAQMIAVNEFADDRYTVNWFSCDRSHLRNMLGLTKGYNNSFAHFNIKTIRLNTRYKEVATIISDFAKAKLSINIELYYEEEQK